MDLRILRRGFEAVSGDSPSLLDDAIGGLEADLLLVAQLGQELAILGRMSSTKSVVRGVRMSAHRFCRTTYLAVSPETDATVAVDGAFRRW